MSKLARAGTSTVVCLALAGFFCVVPSLARKAAAVGTQNAAEAHTVSGKVTAMGKSSFTLAVSSAKLTNESSRESAKTMTFQVDGNTTIDGALQVGVDADVTYRIDNGQYLALSIRVGQQKRM